MFSVYENFTVTQGPGVPGPGTSMAKAIATTKVASTWGPTTTWYPSAWQGHESAGDWKYLFRFTIENNRKIHRFTSFLSWWLDNPKKILPTDTFLFEIEAGNFRKKMDEARVQPWRYMGGHGSISSEFMMTFRTFNSSLSFTNSVRMEHLQLDKDACVQHGIWTSPCHAHPYPSS